MNGTYNVVSSHTISIGTMSGFVKRWIPMNGTYDVVLGNTISIRILSRFVK